MHPQSPERLRILVYGRAMRSLSRVAIRLKPFWLILPPGIWAPRPWFLISARRQWKSSALLSWSVPGWSSCSETSATTLCRRPYGTTPGWTMLPPPGGIADGPEALAAAAHLAQTSGTTGQPNIVRHEQRNMPSGCEFA